MHLNARRLHEGLTELLKQHVTALGAIDAADIAEGKEEEVKMPSEILSMLRYTYDPEIDMEILEGWYRDSLRRNVKGKEENNDWNQS